MMAFIPVQSGIPNSKSQTHVHIELDQLTFVFAHIELTFPGAIQGKDGETKSKNTPYVPLYH